MLNWALLSLVVWQSNYHSCYYKRPVCPCQSWSSNINPAQQDYYFFILFFIANFNWVKIPFLLNWALLSLVVWQSNYHSCYYKRPVCPCQSWSSNINPAQQDSVWAQLMSSPSINMEFKALWTLHMK